MPNVVVSAPGKLLLLGDHAVVHGRPCLVTAIDRRLTLSARLTPKPIFQLIAPELSLVGYQKPLAGIASGPVPKAAEYVEYAVAQFIQKYPLSRGVQITAGVNEIGGEFGFGTSSAVTVATIKALSELSEQNLSNRAVFDLACQTVLALKGVGSGADIAAATYGGLLRFVTGGASIEPLAVRPFNLIVAYSGHKANTPMLIRTMNAKLKLYPDIVNGLFDTSEQIVKGALQDLKTNNLARLGELFTMHQGVLTALGVSTPELNTICSIATSAGAYGAKLSGAGGGDSAIVLASATTSKPVMRTLSQAGFACQLLQTGAEGVRVERQSVE